MDHSKSDSCLISLDLSTACTGIAIYRIRDKKLLKYYSIKPNTKGMSKLETLEVALCKIEDLTLQLTKIIQDYQPQIILIEQINRGVNRLAQKTLDILHGQVLFAIREQRMLHKVQWLDTNGTHGWRPLLGLRLSEEDKKANKETRKSIKKNKKLKADVITWKTLAIRYVDKTFKIKLDDKDNDIADAIAMGHAYLLYVLK